MPPEVMRKAKQLGFSDKQIALAVQRWVESGLATLLGHQENTDD